MPYLLLILLGLVVVLVLTGQVYLEHQTTTSGTTRSHLAATRLGKWTLIAMIVLLAGLIIAAWVTA